MATLKFYNEADQQWVNIATVGKSAYQSAKDGGYPFDEETFNESLASLRIDGDGTLFHANDGNYYSIDETDPIFETWKNGGSIAAGSFAIALTNSIAIGNGATANGSQGVAIGYASRINSTTATNSVLIGANWTTSAPYFIGIGNGTSVNGLSQYRIAIGRLANAYDGIGAIAIGSGTYSVGDGSISLGYQSEVQTNDLISTEIHGPLSIGSELIKRRIVNVKQGVNNYDAVNVSQLNEVISNLDNFVDLTSNQTITGVKTFTGNLVASRIFPSLSGTGTIGSPTLLYNTIYAGAVGATQVIPPTANSAPAATVGTSTIPYGYGYFSNLYKEGSLVVTIDDLQKVIYTSGTSQASLIVKTKITSTDNTSVIVSVISQTSNRDSAEGSAYAPTNSTIQFYYQGNGTIIRTSVLNNGTPLKSVSAYIYNGYIYLYIVPDIDIAPISTAWVINGIAIPPSNNNLLKGTNIVDTITETRSGIPSNVENLTADFPMFGGDETDPIFEAWRTSDVLVAGLNALSNGSAGAVLLGPQAEATMATSLTPGTNAAQVAIGGAAKASNGSVAVGFYAEALGRNCIAIGGNAKCQSSIVGDIVIGANASSAATLDGGNIVIGITAAVQSLTTYGSVIMGAGAKSSASGEFMPIAIGMNANVNASHGVAIGAQTMASAVSIGAGCEGAITLGSQSNIFSGQLVSSDENYYAPLSIGVFVEQSVRPIATRRIIGVSPGVNDNDTIVVSQIKTTGHLIQIPTDDITPLSKSYILRLGDLTLTLNAELFNSRITLGVNAIATTGTFVIVNDTEFSDNGIIYQTNTYNVNTNSQSIYSAEFLMSTGMKIVLEIMANGIKQIINVEFKWQNSAGNDAVMISTKQELFTITEE